MNIKLTGVKQMLDKIEKLRTGFKKEVEEALQVEALIELNEAKMRVPIDTGVLFDSGFVDYPKWSGDKVSVQIGFSASYAVYVHEDLQAFHRNGRAKFLESTLRESAPHMRNRLAARINLKKAGRR